MKKILVTLTLLTACVTGHAQFEDRLTQLQRAYDKEIRRVTEPVDQKYENALIALQKSYIEANKLEEALEVKKEIEALKARRSVAAVTDSRPPLGQEPSSPENAGSSDLKEWKGDIRWEREGGESVIKIEGVRGGARKISRVIKVEDFPGGAAHEIQIQIGRVRRSRHGIARRFS